MRQIVSLKHFLSTGQLGTIFPEMTLLDVARTLGAPQDFFINKDVRAFPLHWGYDSDGPVLEFNFLPDPPHNIDWFQIESAMALNGDFCRFGRELLLTTDGLTGRSTPSDFLKSGAFDEAATVVHLSQSLQLTIICGRISIHFDGAGDIEDALDTAEKEAIFSNFGRALDFKAIDALLEPVDIYSHAELRHAESDHVMTRATCSMTAYLAMLGTPEPPPTGKP